MDRDYDKLKILSLVNEKELLTEAYIIDFDNNNMQIYIPDYNISHNFNIFSNKIIHAKKFIKINDNLQIIDLKNNQSTNYHKYQN